MVQFSDPPIHPLHERWHRKLTDAQRRYREDGSPESQTEYAHVLRAFTDLVLRNEIPEE